MRRPCKGGNRSGGRPKGAKVERLNQITEYGVQITEKTTEGDGWLEYRV